MSAARGEGASAGGELDRGATIDTLARLLDAPFDKVSAGVKAALAGDYHSWRVPKGDGRERRIDAPAPPLRALQRLVLDRLLDRAPVSPSAHGFVPGRSVVTNALVHAPSARALLRVDLEEAYPSVGRRRVRAALEWGLGPIVVATLPSLERAARDDLWELLATISTYRGVLPQGAPTSGALLNSVCGRLDRRCWRVLRRWSPRLEGLRYSRYADDLAFTASEPLPAELVEEVRREVLRSGFRINRRKVRLATEREGALVICGVRIVDGRLGLPRAVLRRYRAILHRASALPAGEVPREVRDLVHGVLGHLTMVTADCPRLLDGPLRRLLLEHGDWLRARVDETRSPRWPRYGAG